MDHNEELIPEWDRQESSPSSEFETLLRQHSLGSLGDRGSDVLYQCGYAAGRAAAQLEAFQAVHRWQRLGLSVAALLTLVLGVQAWWLTATQYNLLALRTPEPIQPNKAAEQMEGVSSTLHSPIEQPMWGKLVRSGQSTEEQTSMLRASMRDWRLPEQVPQVMMPSIESSETPILRPQDCLRLLEGEV